jgi:hypothetical protein
VTNPTLDLFLLALLGVVAFGLSLLVRRRWSAAAHVDPGPWTATLSYVATAYGVIVGFSIIFLFGQFAGARSAVGDEATAIGTAFDESALFPDTAPAFRQSLICYGLAVPEYGWPALREQQASPVVDQAFQDIVASLADEDAPTTGAIHSGVATNMALQVGNISSARATRLVAAETSVPRLLWVLLIGGGIFVIPLIFVVTSRASPITQAGLVAASTVFTVVMVMLIYILSTPFAAESGRVTPRLIEETTASMQHEEPTLTHCDFATDR